MPITDQLQTIHTSYDANNNATRIEEVYSQLGSQVTTKTYDAFDRLETVTDRWNQQIRHTYDANGNRTLLEAPGTQRTSYLYDGLNRTKTVITASGATTYRYLQNSRLR